mgnify:CR=1 FL=1
MRCPWCGSPVMIRGSSWKCGWCGDSGSLKRTPLQQPEITLTLSFVYHVDLPETWNDLKKALGQLAPKNTVLSQLLGKALLHNISTGIQNAGALPDEKKAAELEEKIRKNKFDLNDLLDQITQLRKMGSIQDTLAMLPGMGKKLQGVDVDEKQFDRLQALIRSMTPKERENPDIINPSRKRRIAAGSGQKVEDVNRLLNQHKQMQKLFKQFNGKGSKKKMRRMGFDPSKLGM